jgi:PAS domain S-box-containing protein
MSHTDSILIVDDDPRFCESLKGLLSDQGYKMQTSNSGKEAVECLAKNSFDLALLDIVLPDMDGHKIMDYINSQSPETLVIVITGHASIESAVESLRRGGYDYLRKPFEPDELSTTVKNALDKKRLKRDSEMAKEALRDSEKRYRFLFEHLPIGTGLASAAGKVISINKAMEAITGYSLEALKKINLADTYENPEDRRALLEAINRYGSVVDYPVRLKRKDGTLCDVLLTISRVHHLGKEDLFQTICVDVSKRKQAEEEKKKLETRLQQAQKMEAIATLAGGIAHEFNNTLVGITGNIDLLQMELPDSENISKYAERMKDSTHRMAHLTDQLLAYARGGKYRPKNISLNDFVEETQPLIKKTIDPSIHLETSLHDDIFNVYADLTQMQLVLSAILNNSAEAIEGKGRIRISTNNKEIIEEFAKTHPGLKPGPYVCLTIADSGKGMDKETRSRIFEPFFTTKFRGRGLGMAAVYGIVKNHSGWISVDSQLGKGTVVRIYLPAIASTQARRAGLPAIASTQARRAGLPAVKVQVEEKERPRIEPIKGEGTILVIEDEDIVIDVILQMLENLGYRILLAKTGKEAINIAKSFDGDIDLAILDIVLPDLAGKEAYSRIMEARPNLKVIVCSAYSIDGPPREVLDIGAQGFIQKPFSYATLSEKLKEVLEGK